MQVLIAIVLGAALGHFAPELGASLKPLGDGFIKLIKMVISPIVFVTVVLGIAKVGDMREVGRLGVKAIIYFEVLTSIALAIGLIVANIVQPGAGINADPSKLDPKAVAGYATSAGQLSAVDLILKMIPDSVVGAFTGNDVLPVLFFAVIFGLALTKLGPAGRGLVDLLDQLSHALFGVIALIMKLAPIGAFGAMAFTIGAYGLGSLVALGKLMACVYLTCIVFIFGVLGVVARLAGFSIWKFLRYIREELLIVLGTSSSETALPRLMAKLENAGCPRAVVGLVVPTGYSFNLDGTSIYLTMAALFVAQATNTNLSLSEQLSILGVLLLTSKGATTVTGSGFITLAATLSVTGRVPVAGLALLLGIDRFMSEARALTNLVGNGVATLVIAKWERKLNMVSLQAALASPPSP